jgi:hypothetical protein
METSLGNIELERAAGIAFDSLKENSRNDIVKSLNHVFETNSINQLKSFRIDGDSRLYYVLNTNNYRLIFDYEFNIIHVHAIYNFGK